MLSTGAILREVGELRKNSTRNAAWIQFGIKFVNTHISSRLGDVTNILRITNGAHVLKKTAYLPDLGTY